MTNEILQPVLCDTNRLLLIAFLNKGIDFIDINSILKDKNVVKHIPPYFKNKETPAICYSYKKPLRNLIIIMEKQFLHFLRL